MVDRFQKLKIAVQVLPVVMFLVSSLCLEAVPLTLQYQGQVLISGAAYEGAARFKFALVDSSARSLWSHDLSSQNGTEPTSALMLPVARGLYSIRLGDSQISGMAPIPAVVFTNEVIRLRVWFNDGTNGFQQLTPDREIGSVAFAVRSKTAEVAESLPSGLVNEDHLSTTLRNSLSEMSAQIAALSNLVNNVQSAALAQAQADLSTLSNHVNNVQGAALAGAQSDLGALSNLVSNVQMPQLDQARTDVVNLQGLTEQTTFVSTDPRDTNLLASGRIVFRKIDATAWASGPSGSPSARSGHTAVWSGREFIVWGGSAGGSSVLNTGGKYDPGMNEWVATSVVDAPLARRSHGAAWTGTKMFVWGGSDGSTYLPDGGLFDPMIQRWFPVGPSGLLGREGHVTLQLGSRIAVWGGRNANGRLGDGALYNPDANSWVAIPRGPGSPPPRTAATAVWTGDSMIVWGGRSTMGELGDGARLVVSNGNPTGWLTVSRMGGPRPREGHTAVWTGSKMIVWGGTTVGLFLDDGAIYDPASDRWSPMSRQAAPTGRSGHSAVWTGSEMLIVGGADLDGELAGGSAYDPETDTWRNLTTAGAPAKRKEATAAWNGLQLIVFGGLAEGLPVAALQRLNPEPPVFLYRKP